MKKAVSALIALVMVLSCLPFTVYAGFFDVLKDTADNFSRIMSESSVEEITDSGSTFFIIPEIAQNMAVGTGTDNLSKLVKFDSDTAQSWLVHSSGDSYYFEDAESHKVLEVAGGNAEKRARMQLASFDGSDKQLWQIEFKDTGFAIRSKLNTAFSFNSAGNRNTEGNAIQLWGNGNTEHQFYFVMDNPGLKKIARDSSSHYYICSQNSTDSALDISSNGTAQLWTVRPEVTHSWIVREVEGFYYFEDYITGKVLEVSGGKAKNSVDLKLADFDSSDKQFWTIKNEGKGFYRICSKLDENFVIDNSGSRTNNGNRIILYTAKNGSNQKFKFVEDTGIPDTANDFERYGLDEAYFIIPCNTGMGCVDLDNSNSSNHTTVQIWRPSSKNHQQWYLEKKGDYYCIKNRKYGKVMEVSSGKAADGQRVSAADYNGSDKQLWSLEDLSDGSYALHSKLDYDYVLDVYGASHDNGTQLNIYKQHNHNNQRFRFVHASTVEPMSEWGARRHDCDGSNWDVWDGSIDTDWYYNTGKDARVYYIDSAAGLAGLSSLVRDNGIRFKQSTIVLTRDINLAGIEWRRIGTEDDYFEGSFNGAGHSIIGLSITTFDDNDGFFGCVAGSIISNFAIKGAVSGDLNVGGVVGDLNAGQLINVYSEVRLTNATDDRAGGLVGGCGYAGYIDHCTQNAKVNNNDDDPDRGGIVGRTWGRTRYCVNNATVDHNWDCGGGIAGTLSGGRIEYCANHGTIGGGGNSERIGGICGESVNYGFIFGCYNDGKVYSTDDDYIGGIVGRCPGWYAVGCVNVGRVYGDDQVGGISGWGRPRYCFNAGKVTGDSEVGAISGADGASDCFALAWSASYVSGNGGLENSEWITAEQVINGGVTDRLNHGGSFDIIEDFNEDIEYIFTQNIGSDPYPTFGSARVKSAGNSSGVVNEEYQVRAEVDRDYGTVTGVGTYKSGPVTLKAIPAPGCVFDHFEVKSTRVGKMSAWDGSERDGVEEVIKKYTDSTITLTGNIKQSYTVRAVFAIFDDTPEDMKITVKVEVECVDDAGGWNSDILPIELIDSAGEPHLWEVSRSDLDDEGEKLDHTFDLGSASPIAVYATPDFGGGLTFRDYGLKARMWVNGSGQAIESGKVMIRSWPFISSKWGSDYMSIGFENVGNSKVGYDYDDKADNWVESYTNCKDAWKKAKSDKEYTIRLESAWLLDGTLELNSGESVRIDLNGYPIIRTIKKTQDDGELFKINGGATLTIVDSTPTRKSCGNFTGGSIQGGRSDNTAGLIECNGTLNMTGGTLYNGGTTDKGGAIKLSGGGTANLTNVLISDCWTDKAVFYQNEGGAIYMNENAKANLKNCTIRNCRALDYGGGIYLEDDNNRLNCENVNIIACTADENFGGGVHQDRGETNWIGGSIKNCRAKDDDGAGFYQDDGEVYFENVRFDHNHSVDNGGAFYCNTDDKTWFIGCTFIGNTADDHGGALYFDNNYLYMENCSVVSNTAGGDGGGIYIDSAGSIDVCGRMIIRNNGGSGSMDNLVLEKGAYIHNHGLQPGSEIHLRSYSDGNVELSSERISEYQLKQYFVADYGKLELTDTKDVDTQLRASVFSQGRAVLITGIVLIILILLSTVYYKKKGRKEEHNEKV